MVLQRRLENAAIRTKITTGFMCLLLILGIVGGTAYVSLSQISAAEEIVTQRADIANLANDVALKFINVRRFAREYAHSGELEAADQTEAALKASQATVDRALVEIHNPVRLAKAREIADLQKNYAQSFVELRHAMEEQQEIAIRVLNPTGIRLTRGFETLIATAVAQSEDAIATQARIGLQAAMQARLDANKALGRQDEAQIRAAEESFHGLSVAIADLQRLIEETGLRAALDDIAKLSRDYSTAFSRTVKLAGQVDKAIDGPMKEEGDRISANATAIAESAEKDLVAANLAIRHAITLGQSLSLILTAAGLALAALLAWRLGAMIARPMVGMTEAMRVLSAGNTAVTIPGAGRGDEIGQMAAAVQIFRDNRIEADRLAGEQETERLAKARRGERIEALTQTFEAKAAQLVSEVSASAAELQNTSSTMTRTADRTHEQAANVATAAAQASGNVQTVASASEQLAASIHEISRQVAESTKVAERARAGAERTDTVVQALADGADKIGQVVSLISDIAGQTNLLALNATIEAARAGEAGKGFAVVASEVKGLATQTAKATGDIAEQISHIQSATKEAVRSIQDIGGTINEISAIASAIAVAVEQQGAATRDIAQNVQQAATGTQEVTTYVGGVSSGAAETSAAASHVQQAADSLSHRAEQLRGEVRAYIDGVQAA